MNVLLLAPQPFYQNRGTPIAVRLVLRVLSERPCTKVDVVTYHEGESVELPDVRIYRSQELPGLNDIGPGFSVKKLCADVLLFAKAWKLVRENDYDLIHAGEEAVFFAMFFKKAYGIPFAYDMDSSIAQQLTEQVPALSVFSDLFGWLESQAIQRSLINFPVCNALAELCRGNGSRKTVTLHDISQLDEPGTADEERIQQEVNVRGTVLLYVGNLESYQGIDLLLESFAYALEKESSLTLAIVGGVDEKIQHYRKMASQFGIAEHTFFLGPRPFEDLGDYLASADVLVSPRIEGINTPMKIFPYLHSGKPVLATDLRTHNQLLTEKEAFLAAPDAEEYGKGMLKLAGNPSLREQLGQKGRAFVERNHTYEAHRKRLSDSYDWIEEELG